MHIKQMTTHENDRNKKKQEDSAWLLHSVTTPHLPLKRITNKLCLGEHKGFHSTRHTAYLSNVEHPKKNLPSKMCLFKPLAEYKTWNTVPPGQTPVHQGKTASRDLKGWSAVWNELGKCHSEQRKRDTVEYGNESDTGKRRTVRRWMSVSMVTAREASSYRYVYMIHHPDTVTVLVTRNFLAAFIYSYKTFRDANNETGDVRIT